MNLFDQPGYSGYSKSQEDWQLRQLAAMQNTAIRGVYDITMPIPKMRQEDLGIRMPYDLPAIMTWEDLA